MWKEKTSAIIVASDKVKSSKGKKIVFLCGSLEPGKDGVGDYTRRIAGTLNKDGYQTRLLSLNDKFVQTAFEGQQPAEGDIIQVLRLPSAQSWKERMKLAKVWIDTFDPNWVSLQYVPFAFHDKGLHVGLDNFLKQLGGIRKWHIMFHELWLGMHQGSPLKLKAWGWFQKQQVRSLVARLNPSVIHTQVELYQSKLNKLGIKSQLLPLFSNISKHQISASLSKKDSPKEKSKLSFIVFGSIHPDTPIAQFVREAIAYSKTTRTKMTLTMLGRCGAEQERWQDVWQSEGLEVKIMGEQNPEEISKQLQLADIGIATTPFLLIEKSGSVAAMQQHSLPVICISKSWNVKGAERRQKPGIAEYREGNFESLLCSMLPAPHFASLVDVCVLLEQSLLSA